MLRWTDEEMRAYMARMGRSAPSAIMPPMDRFASVGKSIQDVKSPALATASESKMNKLERAYSQVLAQRQHDGEVLWWAFERIKLKLAPRTYYTPDFVVALADGTLEAHETKGFMRDDAAVKLKVANEMYPFVFRLVKKAKGGSWNITRV